MDDLRERIADTRPTAGEVAPIDAEWLVARGRRQRRVEQAATGVASALVVVLAVFGLGVADRPAGPQIADERDARRVEAPISVLDGPAGPEDVLPDAVRTQLELDDAAASTVRLARRTPSQRWYVYVDDPPPGPSATVGERVCLVGFVASDPATTYTGGCTSRRVPVPATARVTFVTRSSELGTAGIVTDGAATVGEAAGSLGPASQVDRDLPVINNVFVLEQQVDDETAATGTIAWDGAATGSVRLTETLRSEWDPRDQYVNVRVGSPDGVTLAVRGQVVDGRLDPATRTINFVPMGQSFHANEVGPFDTEPPGTCTVVFDTLTLGVVDGEIDCTLTTPEGDASVDLTGTFTTQ